jgi:hypothetical protein
MPGEWFHQKIRNKYLWIGMALLLLTLVYLIRTPLTLKDAYLIDATGKREAVTLPLLRNMPPGAEYVISGTLEYKRWLNCSAAHLIPDDQLVAIRVNRREVSLAKVAPAALCDYVNGFHYNFGDYLRKGANQIEILLKNTAGPSGLNWQPSYRDWRMVIGILLVGLVMLGLVYLLLTDTAGNPVFAVLFSGSFLIRFLYYLDTPFGTRTHDVGGHLQYIEYMVNHFSLPNLHYGWQTYQPPLYYLLAAAVYKLLNWFGISAPEQIWRYLQLLSLLLFIGFLAVTWQIIKRTVAQLPVLGERDVALGPSMTGDWERYRLYLSYLLFALIAFWPSGIIHSIRIGNDGLFYLLYALGLWFLIKWQDDDASRSLYWSFALITLALITKANALVLYMVFGCVYLLKFGGAPVKRRYLRPTLILVAIFMIGFGITFGRMVQAKLKGANDNFIVANASGLQGVAVGNGLQNYLYFDLQSFLTEPYVNPFEDRGGRQFFWNYLFKTGLVGEFSYNSLLHRVLTTLLSFSFLLMFLYTTVSLIVFSSYLTGQLVLVLNAVFLLLSAVAFRISIPAACSNDFRYILPLLISFIGFFGWGIWCYLQQKWHWVAKVGCGLAVFFSVTSIVFFVTLSFCAV